MSQHKTVKAWWWRQWAIMAGALIITVILIWQLSTLSPKNWCNNAVAERIQGEGIILSLQACLQLQTVILGIKDHAIIGLIAALIMTNLLFMVSEFRLGAKAQGPGGFGFEVNNDDQPPTVQKIEGEVTLTPEEKNNVS